MTTGIFWTDGRLPLAAVDGEPIDEWPTLTVRQPWAWAIARAGKDWGRAKRTVHALADAESFGLAACLAHRAGDARRAAALARIAARAASAAGAGDAA